GRAAGPGRPVRHRDARRRAGPCRRVTDPPRGRVEAADGPAAADTEPTAGGPGMTLAATVAGLAGRAGAPHLAAAESHGFLSPTGVEITFLLVGLVTLGAAVITVTTRQLVHAALWLVVALGGLAVEYLLLTAEFIAWVQVLIYVGSVIVLILFGLMLPRAPIGRSPDADSATGGSRSPWPLPPRAPWSGWSWTPSGPPGSIWRARPPAPPT